MSDNRNNHDRFELLDAALRRGVPPEKPLPPELQARIVASIRAESSGRRRVVTLRRFAIGAGTLAAGVLLAIVLLAMSRVGVNSPNQLASPDTRGPGGDIFVTIPPAPVLVDRSIVAVQEFATDSVVQEMRYLARDASEIGSAMLVMLPVDVVGDGRSRWWVGLLDE